MSTRLAGIALALLASVLLPVAAWAGPSEQAESLRQFLANPVAPETLFAPSFLADVPAEQAKSVARGLAEQFGKPLSVLTVTRRSGSVIALDVEYDHAIVSMVITVSGDGPRPVIGWLVTGSRVKNDSFERISDELESLPGEAAILLHRLDGREEPRLAYNANKTLAIGSTFKLWVLAELASQVKAGKRRWTDVVPLGAPSLPSGITQDWPKGAPMTLHSLATLMISISDNSATDTLVETLGRDRVTAQADGGNEGYPVLLTREAFALKMPAQDPLLQQLRQAGARQRAKLLDEAGAVLVRENVDPARLVKPAHIDAAEWFASPLDLVRTLDRLRRMKSKEAMDILAISPGVPLDEAARFAWVGYKGGSEAGVISHSFLIHTRDDRWYALSASWNNPAALVDKDRFGVIVRRALTLITQE